MLMHGSMIQGSMMLQTWLPNCCKEVLAFITLDSATTQRDEHWCNMQLCTTALTCAAEAFSAWDPPPEAGMSSNMGSGCKQQSMDWIEGLKDGSVCVVRVLNGHKKAMHHLLQHARCGERDG